VPAGHSATHRHAASGFVFAYVLSGAIRSQVDLVYRAGDSWFEPAGAHHVINENASSTEPERLLAVLVADTGVPLTIYNR
jgi:quercetin dioxygenase-like cupin family protein